MQSKRLLNTEIKELLTSDAFMREGRAEKKQHWVPDAGSREEYGAWMHKTSPMLKGKQTATSYLRKYNSKVASFYCSVLPLSILESFRVLDEEYDYEKALSSLERYRKKNTRELTIEFYDEKNVPDRILSEFAPWKKRCVYDRDTKLYQLTIFYQKQDSFELVVRLLGYGSAIRIREQDSRVFEQYVMRIDKQIALERERDTEGKGAIQQ